MQYAEFMSNIASLGPVTFNSVEECEEMMTKLGVEQRIRQLGHGGFRSDMVVRETELATHFSDRFSTSFSGPLTTLTLNPWR